LAAQAERHPLDALAACVSLDEVLALRKAVRAVRVSDEVKRYAVELVRATRVAPGVQLGASPRASLALIGAAQALAVFDGHAFVVPEHVQELAVPVIAHRLARRLTPAGQLVAAGLVAAAIVGPNTRITVSYQALTFLYALLVVAGLLSLRRPPRLEIRRRLPRFATAGEPLTYPVRVRHTGPGVAQGLALLEELDDPRPSFEEFRTTPEPEEAQRNVFDRAVGYPRWAWLLSQQRRATVDETPLPALPAGGEIEVRLALTPLRRGRVTVTATSVALRESLVLVRA